MAGAPAASRSLALSSTYPGFSLRHDDSASDALEKVSAHPACFDSHAGISVLLNFRAIEAQGCTEQYLGLAEKHMAKGASDDEPQNHFLAVLIYFQNHLGAAHENALMYLNSEPPEHDNLVLYICHFNEAMECITNPTEFLRTRTDTSQIHIQNIMSMLFAYYEKECQPFFDQMEEAFQDPETKLAAYLIYEPLTCDLTPRITGAEFELKRHERLCQLSVRAEDATQYAEVEALFGTLDVETMARLAGNFASLASDQDLYAELFIPIVARLVNTMQAMSGKPGREIANPFLPGVIVHCQFANPFSSAETYRKILQCFSRATAIRLLECPPYWDIAVTDSVQRHIQQIIELDESSSPLRQIARQQIETHLRTLPVEAQSKFLLAVVLLKLDDKNPRIYPASEALLAKYPKTAFYLETMSKNSVEFISLMRDQWGPTFEYESEGDDLPKTDLELSSALQALWSDEFTAAFNALIKGSAKYAFTVLSVYLHSQIAPPLPSRPDSPVPPPSA